MSDDPFENYPLESAALQKWISDGLEGIHLEFKLKISVSELKSKAEFIRDMISLANMAWSEKKHSYLVVGVTDSGEVVDSSESMVDDATYQQIVDSFVNPSIDFTLRKELIKDVPIYVFVILPKDNFHITNKTIQESSKIYLAKNECWFRKGSSKYQIEPLRVLLLKYGGKAIQTDKELAEWIKIDQKRANTLISEENLIRSVTNLVFPLKSPSILVGTMGCGKTTLLYQIGLLFLDRNFKIIVNLEKYPKDLSSELRQNRLILFIDSLESILESKQKEIRDIPLDLPIISTMRTLNWQRYCRTFPKITELFTKIELPNRSIDNVSTVDFLKQIAYSNIREFQISIPDDQTQRKKVLDLLIT
ncbi:MAG: hypothetical protein HeimC3_35860 [Candidatus Heimdallarchaeota archaeon LC_3]|nr:MAG: hypothetical protein HeimC3_35860 [Candidatus Heimdallarchaeota archaeon LC_3]